MNHDRTYLELRCPGCSWSEVCGPAEIAQWLLRAGKLRRGSDPEWEIMVEVLRATAPKLACPECGRAGLCLGPARDDADWPETLCEACSRPIERERLELLPDTTFCAACQRKAERGETTTETEYCPKCGAPMAVKPSKSAGLTRYVMVCTGDPPCRLR